MIYKKYSEEYKKTLVKEFLEKKAKNPKLRKKEFASEKLIPETTFFDWHKKYQVENYGFCNITEELNKLNEAQESFVSSSTALIEKFNDETQVNNNTIKFKYNGVTIEFDNSLLERALNVLKSW